MKKQVGLLLFVVVIAGLLAFAAGGDVAQADSAPVLPPHANAFGKTYEEWAAEFWKWAGRVEVEFIGDHPLIAQGAIDCSLGQEGQVWFLGGFYGGSGPGTRTCEVPANKALFFPIVNVFCSPLAGDDDDPEFLLACALSPGDVYDFDFQMYPVSATIDGKEIPNLEEYYVLSGETFHIDPVPYPNVFDYPAWISVPEGSEGDAATSGYYLLLPPLSKGPHTIEFVGVIGVNSDLYTTAMTYQLEVTNN